MQQSQTISRISYRKSRVWGSKELPKLPIGEQKRIYVSIKKRNVAGAVLFKDVDDPEAISHFVHYKPVRDKARSRGNRTPVREGLHRRPRAPSTLDRWKRRSLSWEYNRRSRGQSKSASRERFHSPSSTTQRSPSPRYTRRVGAEPSRSIVITKQSLSSQRRSSQESYEKRQTRSRSRTSRRSVVKYRDRRDKRRSRSPLYQCSRRRGSRSWSPTPSMGVDGRRSSSRERRRMRSRTHKNCRRPTGISRSPRMNCPREVQYQLDPSAKADPYGAMKSAMAIYYKHIPLEQRMNLPVTAVASVAVAAAIRFALDLVPNRFFRVRAASSFPPSKSKTTSGGNNSDEIRDVSKESTHSAGGATKNSYCYHTP